MPNITLSIDEDTIKKVRRIAVERDTTLTAMVREFLRSVADRDATDRQRAVRASGSRSRSSAETWGSGAGRGAAL